MNSNTECPICLNTFSEPLFLNCCGNSVCKQCLTNWNRLFCPICRGNFTTNGIVPNRSLERVLEDYRSNFSSSSQKIPRWSIRGGNVDGSCKEVSQYFGAKVSIRNIPLSTNLKYQGLWTMLHHPNIAQIYGRLENNDKSFLVEYCEGGSLADNIRPCKGCLSEDNIISILAGTISALEYIHSGGNVHGSISPSSILLQSRLLLSSLSFGSNMVKVIDVGMTPPHTAMAIECSDINVIRYTAPEYILLPSMKFNAAMDIYSFGVLIWELLYSELPWGTYTTADEILNSIKRGDRLNTKANGTMEGLRDIMIRCLHSNVRPTASEISLRLRLLVEVKVEGYSLSSDDSFKQRQALMESKMNDFGDDDLMSATATLVAETMISGSHNTPLIYAMLTRISALLATESATVSSADLQDICVAVVSTLKMLDCNEYVGQMACRVLIKLIMINNELTMRIIDSGAVEAIITLIQKINDNEMLVEAAVSCIAHICTVGRTAAYRVMACSGGEAIIQCLLTNFNSMKVIVQCCSAIGTLCYGQNIDIISRLVASGATEAVLDALNRYVTEIPLLEQGCAALAILCSTSTPLIRERLSSTSACETITLLLQTAPRNSIIMEHTLSAMTCLATMGLDNRNRLSTESCSFVVSVMLQFINDAKVIKQGLGAVNAMALNNQLLISYFFLADVSDLLTNIFDIHYDNPTVIARACVAVACLASSSNIEHQESLTTAGLGGAVVNSVKDYLDNKEVVKQGVQAIVVLSSCECALTLQTLTEFEAIEVLQQAINRYDDIRDIVEPGEYAQHLLESY